MHNKPANAFNRNGKSSSNNPLEKIFCTEIEAREAIEEFIERTGEAPLKSSGAIQTEPFKSRGDTFRDLHRAMKERRVYGIEKSTALNSYSDNFKKSKDLEENFPLIPAVIISDIYIRYYAANKRLLDLDGDDFKDVTGYDFETIQTAIKEGHFYGWWRLMGCSDSDEEKEPNDFRDFLLKTGLVAIDSDGNTLIPGLICIEAANRHSQNIDTGYGIRNVKLTYGPQNIKPNGLQI